MDMLNDTLKFVQEELLNKRNSRLHIMNLRMKDLRRFHKIVHTLYFSILFRLHRDPCIKIHASDCHYLCLLPLYRHLVYFIIVKEVQLGLCPFIHIAAVRIVFLAFYINYIR